MKEENFKVSKKSDDKKSEEFSFNDSLVISFYDVKNEDWTPFNCGTYVYVSKR